MKAKYDAAQNALRLVEPLEGVANDEMVDLTVTPTEVGNPSILKFRGCLSEEDGAEMAALIEEMFPTEK